MELPHELIHERLQSKIADLVGGEFGAFGSGFGSAFNVYELGRVTPVKASENTEVPFVTYAINGMKPVPNLNASNSYTEYAFTVETYAMTHAETRVIAARIRDGLDKWRSDEVIGCFITDGGDEYDELGYCWSTDFTIKVRD